MIFVLTNNLTQASSKTMTDTNISSSHLSIYQYVKTLLCTLQISPQTKKDTINIIIIIIIKHI